MSRKAMIFIDGSNLYHNLLSHCGKASLCYQRFANKLSEIVPGRELIRTYYYNCPVDQKEDPVKYCNQQKFFNILYDTPDLEVRLGRLQKKPNGTKLEKGVDVKIAVDMLKKAYHDHFDDAILVSGDADLMEVVQEVKDQAKHVELAFFPTQPCYYLKQACDRSIELNGDFLSDCWYK